MKIAITGGAGYVGAALVEKLSFLPEITEIKVYDSLVAGNMDFFFNTQTQKEKVKFEEGDILETRKLQKLVKDAEVVVHLAAFDGHASDNTALHRLEQVNHWGTAELSYAVENSSVKRFIYLSSADVYGHSDEVKTEDSETAAETPYALSKLRGEGHITRLADKLHTIVVRPGCLVGHGPVKSRKGVANNLFYDAITKKRVSIHGDGKQARPIASLDYLVAVLQKGILGSLPSGIYNVVQGNQQVLDLLEELKAVLPDTEFIFTNHHLHLPSILIDTKHKDLLPKENFSIRNQYEEILKYFRL